MGFDLEVHGKSSGIRGLEGKLARCMLEVELADSQIEGHQRLEGATIGQIHEILLLAAIQYWRPKK